MQTEPQSVRRSPARDHETTTLDLRQVVLAPEQVELHLPIAGPTSRMLAYSIDAAIVLAIELGIVAFVLLSTRWAGPLIDWVTSAIPSDVKPEDIERFFQSGYMLYIFAALLLLQFVLEFAYFTLWETVWSGRSPGKSIMQLRVVSDGGRPVTVQDSMTRNLMRVVDILPGSYLVGLGAMMVSSEGKRLGDLAAGTIVVRLDRPPPPAALPEIDEEATAFRFDRAQMARFGPLDRQLALETLRRLETLPPERAAELLERSVRAICQRIGYGEVRAEERSSFLQALVRASA